jgi:hypothetical protein
MHLKHFLCLSFITLLGTVSYGQQSVEDWQRNHPHVLLIEKSDFNLLSENDLSYLKSYIVYDTEIGIDDLQSYEAEISKSRTLISPKDATDGDAIKMWLGEHQGLKIITNSYYTALSEKEKTIFQNSGVILLEGEIITLKDIENYEDMY